MLEMGATLCNMACEAYTGMQDVTAMLDWP